MRKLMIAAVAAAALVMGGGLSGVLVAESAPASVEVTLTGENYGLLSTLAEDELATASSAYAQINALKVTEAKAADGSAIGDLKGKTIHYLPTKKAEEVMVGQKLQGKTVTITGKLFVNENAIAVGEVKTEAAADAGNDFDALPTTTVTRQQIL